MFPNTTTATDHIFDAQLKYSMYEIVKMHFFLHQHSALPRDNQKTQGNQRLYNNGERRRRKKSTTTHQNTNRQTQIEGIAANCEQISAVSVSKPNTTIGSQRRTLSITQRVRCQLATKGSVTAACFLLFLWDPVLQQRLEASWQRVLIHFTITQSWRMALNWQ